MVSRQWCFFRCGISPIVLGASVMALSPPPFELPKPTGRFAVGTTSWRLRDPVRRESFADGDPRAVEVLAWYPATTTGQTAPYLREGLTEARTFAKLIR